MKTLRTLVFACGCVPVLAATLLASGPPRSPTRKIFRVTLQTENGSSALVVGGSLQVIAKATYSDGTTVTLPDTLGHGVTTWDSSNFAIAKISSQGYVTALAPGPVNITAMVGTLAAEPLTVLVSSAAIAAPEENATPEAGPPAPAREGVSVDDAVGAASPAAAESPTGPENPSASPGPATQPGTFAPENPLEPVTPGAQSAGPVPVAPAGPLPDNFIGPFWTTVSPAGGAASISNAHLFLGVPGGANHDPFSANNQAVRVVQSIGNFDFDVAMKIDSPLVAADGNTSQGLMVLAANGDFLTFALTTDGNRIGLMGRTVTAGTPTTVLEDSAFSEYQNPTYLRLRRSGSAYVALYSVDGATWKQAASFTDTMATASIGPFASNYSNTPANALPVIMAVNWFEVQ